MNLQSPPSKPSGNPFEKPTKPMDKMSLHELEEAERYYGWEVDYHTRKAKLWGWAASIFTVIWLSSIIVFIFMEVFK